MRPAASRRPWWPSISGLTSSLCAGCGPDEKSRALPPNTLVDRWDRRRVLWRTDAYRALVLTALTVAIVAGWAGIPCSGRPGSCSQWAAPCSARPPCRSSPASSPATRRGWNGPTAVWPGGGWDWLAAGPGRRCGSGRGCRCGLSGSSRRVQRREPKAPKKTAPRTSGRWGCRKYGRHACGSARGTPLRSPRTFVTMSTQPQRPGGCCRPACRLWGVEGGG
jgi:hypothetical protein